MRIAPMRLAPMRLARLLTSSGREPGRLPPSIRSRRGLFYSLHRKFFSITNKSPTAPVTIADT
jgi:hypothetical protein